MARSQIKEKRKESRRNTLKNKLEQLNEEGAKRYQDVVADFERENASEESAKNQNASEVADVIVENLTTQQNVVEQGTDNITAQENLNSERNIEKMGKEIVEENFGFDDDSSLDAKLEDLTLPNQDNTEVKEDGDKSTDAKKSGSKVDVVEERTLREAIKMSINDGDVQEKNRKEIALLLQNNVFIKQFATNGTFARGFTLTSKDGAKGQKDSDGKDAPSDIVNQFAIENIKPGRAKTVVVTMPRVLQNILEGAVGSNMDQVYTNIVSNLGEGGTITLSEQEMNDTVDVVMDYDAMMQRVANLMEGKIAEFGGVGGELDYSSEKWIVKTDTYTGAVNWDHKVPEGEKTTIKKKQHVIYNLVRPSDAVLLKGINGTADESEVKALTRFRAGKSPLKRTKNAFSALYTPKNFVSTVKYVEAAPFAPNFTMDDAKRVSAKAIYRSQNVQKGRMISHDEGLIDNENQIIKVFDPNQDAAARYDALQVARNYQNVDASGKPRMESVKEKDKETGKTVTVLKPSVAKDMTVTSRVPRDFFTGAPIKADEMASVKFVKYGESGLNSKNQPTAPRAQKMRVAVDGIDVKVDPTKGIMSTYSIDDDSFEHAKKIMNVETLSKALLNASKKKTSGKGGSSAESALSAGLLSTALANLSLRDSF